MWAACTALYASAHTTCLTSQIDRVWQDRERRDAAWTDRVAPLQLKIVASWQPLKCYVVRDSWQPLHQRLAGVKLNVSVAFQ